MLIETGQSSKAGHSNRYLTGPLKRGFDLAFAGSVAAPVWTVERIAKSYLRHALDEGEDYYVDLRIGGGPEPQPMSKLRTMTNRMDDEVEFDPKDLLTMNNPRIPTKGVHLIRRLRIDETPQLWEVIKNRSSIVGPRPMAGIFFEECMDHLPPKLGNEWHKIRKSPNIKRGVVSPAAVFIVKNNVHDIGPYSEAIAEYDLDYVKRANFGVDLKTCFEALKAAVDAVRSEAPKAENEHIQKEYQEAVEAYGIMPTFID